MGKNTKQSVLHWLHIASFVITLALTSEASTLILNGPSFAVKVLDSANDSDVLTEGEAKLVAWELVRTVLLKTFSIDAPPEYSQADQIASRDYPYRFTFHFPLEHRRYEVQVAIEELLLVKDRSWGRTGVATLGVSKAKWGGAYSRSDSEYWPVLTVEYGLEKHALLVINNFCSVAIRLHTHLED